MHKGKTKNEKAEGRKRERIRGENEKNAERETQNLDENT